MTHDLRFAARVTRKSPGTFFAVFLALALGIGSSTAIFSLVDSVMLRPLPVRDGNRLVRIFTVGPQSSDEYVSMADYLVWKSSLSSFSGTALYRTRQATLTGQPIPERVVTIEAESTLLPVLGVSPIAGHNFSRDDNQPGRNQEAILTWPFWQKHFGGENVIGNRILLDEQGYTIIGILPKSFTLFGQRDLIVPLAFDLGKMENQRGYRNYELIARLAPGVSIRQANLELASAAAALAREFPRENKDVSLHAQDLRSTLVGEGVGGSEKHLRFQLLLLLAAVLSVLAIACVNVAHLQLVRAWARQRELAIRLALGATPKRIFHQMLTESLALSLSGAAAGVLVAFVLIRIIRHLPVNAIPRLDEVSLDWRVLLFALAAGILTGVGFGVVPALRASRLDLNATLKESGARTTSSRAQSNLRQLFVVLETALAVGLLIECSLLAKSFAAVSSLRADFASDHLLTFYLALPSTRYNPQHETESTARLDTILKKIQTAPGVVSAAMTSDLPLSGTAAVSGILIEGKPVPEELAAAPQAVILEVSPGYFQTMAIPQIAGRTFTQRERVDPVVVINQTLAKRFFPGKDPIGKRLAQAAPNARWQQIIGIVADVPEDNIEEKASPQIYFPLTTPIAPWVAVVARVAGDPLRYLEPLRAQIAKVDPAVAVFLPRTMQQIREKQFFWRKLQTYFLAAFALFALLLAAIGIYAVIAYSVRQRTTEIGLRIALGATLPQIWSKTLWQGIQPALMGTAAGLLIGFVAARLTRNLFFATAPTDLSAYLLSTLFILFVALLASAIPAARAALIDPARALRYEL
jgi:putative ABC transport system permease protein